MHRATLRSNLSLHACQIVMAVIAIAARSISAEAQVAYSSGTYTQDFQTFLTTSGSSSITQQQMAEIPTLANGGTVNGWYVYNQSGWATGFRWFSADSGSSSTGGFRSMYSSSGGNLALGSQGSGSSVGFYGLILQNQSGGTINNVTLSYDAVINRNPSTTANTSNLTYRVGATAPVTGSVSTGAGTFNNSAGTWNATTLGFTSPTSGTGAPGTQAAINPMFTIGTKAGNLTGLNWANNDYLYLRWSETDDAGSDATIGIDNVSFAQLLSRSLAWNVAGNGTWDTTTANWTTGSGSTTFIDGDGVTFGNTAGGTISLAGTLQPVSTTIDATAGTYTFSGISGGKISGSTSIAKSNAGTAVFTTANDFTGGTTISGGTVRIDGGDRLGSGQIAFAGGTLESAAAAATTLSTNVAVGATGGTINTGSQNLTVTGATTLDGVLAKTGAGTLTLGGAITSNAGTGYTVSAGTLQLGANATSSGVYRVSAATTLTGNLVISGTQRFDVNGNATISGAGTLLLPTSGALIATSSGDTGGTISSEIVLNSSGASFTPGSWSGTTYTPGTFLATIGATSGANTSSLNSLTVGVISGASDVDFSNNSSTGGGGGQLVLNAASTYTGNTTINFNAPNATGSSSIKLGVDNALPTTTGIVVGTKTGIRAPILDMNGRNQQVGYLADGANVSATQFLTITNLGTADSVLTIGGSVTPGTGFGGLITGGTTAGSRISVVKTGANSQTLSGANTYTGGTTVSAGTLVAGNVSGFGTGGVTVNGGTLDLASLAVANAITANGGTITGASAYAGTQTILGTVSFAGTVAGTVNVGSGGILKGNGTTFGGTVAIGASGMHAPGASPGAQTFNGPLSYAATSKLEWELWDNTNATADAGIDYDAITVTSTGSLAITSGAAVDLLFGTTSGGSTVSWTNAFWDSDRSWTIISASAASSSTGVFTLGSVGSDAAGVAFASARPNAAFSVGRSGSGDIVLSYVAAVPEPSTWALAAVAAACVAGRVLRRRTTR